MAVAWEFSYLTPRNSYMNSAFNLLNIFPSSPSLKVSSSNMEIKKRVSYHTKKRQSQILVWLEWRW